MGLGVSAFACSLAAGQIRTAHDGLRAHVIDEHAVQGAARSHLIDPPRNVSIWPTWRSHDGCCGAPRRDLAGRQSEAFPETFQANAAGQPRCARHRAAAGPARPATFLGSSIHREVKGAFLRHVGAQLDRGQSPIVRRGRNFCLAYSRLTSARRNHKGRATSWTNRFHRYWIFRDTSLVYIDEIKCNAK